MIHARQSIFHHNYWDCCSFVGEKLRCAARDEGERGMKLKPVKAQGKAERLTEISPEIRSLAEQIQQIKKQQTRLGFF